MALLWVRQEWEEEMTNGASPSAELEFQVVTDDADGLYSQIAAEADLRAYLVAEGLDTYGNLPLQSVKVKRLKASKCFRGYCSYGMRQIPEDGKFDFTMDSRPEASRTFMALSTVAEYKPPGYAAAIQNFGLAQPNSDHESQGADVYRPVKTYNVSVWWSLSRFVVGQPLDQYKTLQAYVNLLDTLEGCVNSTTFSFMARGLTFTFAAGECLLAGTRLSQQGADLWQIDFELKKKKNYIEPSLTSWHGSNVTMRGWDRIEFQESAYADSQAIGIGVKPRGAKIYRDYFQADLNQLKVPAP